METYADELARFVDQLAHGPTRIYASWKLTVNRALLLELDAYSDYEHHIFALTRQSADTQEGKDAFREKRAPRYTGQ